MFFIILVLFILLLLLTLYLYQTRHHDHWTKLGVSTAPNKHWFFGHSKDIIMMKRHTVDVIQDVYNSFPKASVVGYYKLSAPSLVLKDPDHIKAILTTDFNIFSKNEAFVDKDVDFLAGYNPFFLYGEEWKTVRAHSTPLTTYAKLRMYFPNVIQVGDVLVDYVSKQCFEHGGKIELEAKQLSGKYTTDVVANALLGVTNNAFESNESLFGSMTKEIFSGDWWDGFKIMCSIVFPKLSPYLRIRFVSRRTEKLLLSLVKDVTKHRMETDEIRNDLFQHMITLKKTDTTGFISDKYIASHCLAFLADGYETSSAAISFVLFELAWNFDVQERLREEIQAMITQTKGLYTIDDVDSLKYLHMVISEALRLHPPGLFLSKEAISDYTLNLKDNDKSIVINKGITVTVPVYSLHMDPKYYPEPDKFDPERFTDENVANRHKFVYIPFGEGPRKCLGQRIALLQMKCFFVKILDNFRLKPSSKSVYPLKIDPKVIIKRPLNGAWINFEPLNK